MQEPFAPRPLPASTLLRFHPTSAPAFAAADLPSSRAELSERAMSLCPVPPGASQNDFGASVLVSATMTRLTTGDLSVRSFEAYIRDFTFVWLIPLSSWASARRSPSAQPTFLSACRFLCRTDSFHSVSSAELRLAHHAQFLVFKHRQPRHPSKYADILLNPPEEGKETVRQNLGLSIHLPLGCSHKSCYNVFTFAVGVLCL